jgi:precorrin-6B methylase 2
MLSSTYVDTLEQLAWSVAETRYGPEIRKQRPLIDAIRELSAAYVAGRAPREQAHQLARLLFFTLADLPKVAYPLAELARSGRLPSGPLRLLDVGAGCGTLTLGALGALDQHPIDHCWAVDHDPEALELCRRLYAGIGVERAAVTGPLRTQVADLGKRRALDDLPGPFSLILIGNVLTELPEGARLTLLRELLAKLADDGALIAIEPALQQTTRDLNRLRDALLEQEHARVFAPCTHQRPCPLADHPKAWCHEIRVWSGAPPRLRKLASQSGLRRRDLKFAYLTLLPWSSAAQPSANVAQPCPDDASGPSYRVVGSLQRSKGRRSVALCADGTLHEALRLDRDKRELNRPFERLNRGRLLWLPGCEGAKQPLRVGAESPTLALDPADESALSSGS